MEVGSEIGSKFKAGDRVMALCNGGAYAEQVPAIVIMLRVVSRSVVRRQCALMLWSTMHTTVPVLPSGCGGCWLSAACTQQLEDL